MRRLFSFLLILVVVVFLAQQQYANSQTSSIGLSIRPAIIEVAAKPGKDTLQTIWIKNITDQPTVVAVVVGPQISSTEQQPGYSYTKYDASEWVKVSADQLSLSPNQEVQVTLTITPPLDAEGGSRYAELIFRPLPSITNSDTNNTLVVPQLSALVLINLPGDLKESVDADLSVPKLNLSRNTLNFSATLTNQGNTHSLVKPSLHIYKDDKEVFTKQLKPELILPEATKTISYDWQPDDNIYGKLSAKLTATYATPTQTASSQPVSFWLMPPFTVLIFYLSSLLALLTLAYILGKRAWRKLRPGRIIHPAGKHALKLERTDTSERKVPTYVMDHLTKDSLLPQPKPINKDKSSKTTNNQAQQKNTSTKKPKSIDIKIK